jgi:hypothetical protein
VSTFSFPRARYLTCDFVLAGRLRFGPKADIRDVRGMIAIPNSGHPEIKGAGPFRAKKRHAQRFAPNFPHGLTRWKFLDRNSGAELLIVHRPGGPTPIGKPSL